MLLILIGEDMIIDLFSYTRKLMNNFLLVYISSTIIRDNSEKFLTEN